MAVQLELLRSIEARKHSAFFSVGTACLCVQNYQHGCRHKDNSARSTEMWVLPAACVLGQQATEARCPDELAPVEEADETNADEVDDFLKANDAAILPTPGAIPVSLQTSGGERS